MIFTQRNTDRIIYKAETKKKININTVNNLNLIPSKLTRYFETIKFENFVVQKLTSLCLNKSIHVSLDMKIRHLVFFVHVMLIHA